MIILQYKRKFMDGYLLFFGGIYVGCSGLFQAVYAIQFRYPVNSSNPVNEYFNHSTNGGSIDWNCGTYTYWWNGPHRGTDFGGTKGTDIFAADDGVVILAPDGEFDSCTTGDCGGTTNPYGNFVKIRHTDGTVTISGHMKQWSIVVSTNQTVSCGQKIGQIGSSGNSTGPHLHFEVRPNQSSPYEDAFDPFSGPCSTSVSYWVDQGGYKSLPSSTCSGGSNLCGDKFGTLYAAYSPYTLTCPVNVPQGQSLHIEPGVVLNYNGNSFTVLGTLTWGP